eukprot:CAMPEP_0174898754 /NCGR_PEP_ID=MMETSP0167-20121228/23637_1 /TAXON_ID=38298 /ORGANISM="Rhodella maculata, Strain CCMP736" /LENGTH=270 /DNA_ID=CAMNT_0016139485 /DNA_START=1 /DNA_END=813 /DNA_ORIENTATION=-
MKINNKAQASSRLELSRTKNRDIPSGRPRSASRTGSLPSSPRGGPGRGGGARGYSGAGQGRDIFALAVTLREKVVVKDRSYHLRVYKQVFVASEAVEVMVRERMARSEEHAERLGNEMVRAGVIAHCVDEEKPFSNGYLFFRFDVDRTVEAEEGSAKFSMQSFKLATGSLATYDASPREGFFIKGGCVHSSSSSRNGSRLTVPSEPLTRSEDKSLTRSEDKSLTRSEDKTLIQSDDKSTRSAPLAPEASPRSETKSSRSATSNAETTVTL